MPAAQRLFVQLLFAALPLLAWPQAVVAAEVESQIKAAYLYKFASYVDWPASAFAQADTPVTIGVMGADAVAAELNLIQGGRSGNSRAVEIRRLKPGESLNGVQMLFIGRDESARLKRIGDMVQSRPVLTVTDSAGALNAGSVINFVMVDDHIRFEVSVAQAEQNGLKISARLLGVAQKIETRRP